MKSTIIESDNQRALLLETLTTKAIHYGSDNNPILTRQGTPGPRWVIDLLGATLESKNLIAAAKGLLSILDEFKGNQLATLGTAAVPLMTACIMLSEGKYSGLMVRKERKQHGTAKQIDGSINFSEPTIIIDDSIGSGGTIIQCHSILQQAGISVEGCAVLVRFHNEGHDYIARHGLKVRYLFDYYHDFIEQMPDEPRPAPNPGKMSSQINWSNEQLSEKLSPAQLVRHTVNHYLATGNTPLPPQSLSLSLTAEGGIWISLREQYGQYKTIARAGFHHLPEEAGHSITQDLTEAAWAVAQQLPAGQAGLDTFAQLGITITFIGKLTACDYDELDNQTYGLLVRSQERPWLFGSALPNMPGIRNTAHQLEHARTYNSTLTQTEPYDLYRFTVNKTHEAGNTSPAGGVAIAKQRQWYHQDDIIVPYLKYAWTQLKNTLNPQSSTDSLPYLFPLNNFGNAHLGFVSLYKEGRSVICLGSEQLDHEQWLAQTIEQALQHINEHEPSSEQNSYEIKLSLLTDKHYLGEFEFHTSIPAFSVGYDALQITQGDKMAVLLPDVAVDFRQTENSFFSMLLTKAGITGGHFQVTRYNCAQWFIDNNQSTYRLDGLLPSNSSPHLLKRNKPQQQLQIWFNYLVSHAEHDGYVRANYYPYFMAYEEDAQHSSLTIQTLWMMTKAKSLGLSNIDINFDIDEILLEISAQPDKERYTALSYLVLLIEALIEQAGIEHDYEQHLQNCVALWNSINTHGGLSFIPEIKSLTTTELSSKTRVFNIINALAVLKKHNIVAKSTYDSNISRLIDYQLHYAQYKCQWYETPALIIGLIAWAKVKPSDEIHQVIFMLCDKLTELKMPNGFLMLDHSKLPELHITASIGEAMANAARFAKTLNEEQHAIEYQELAQHALETLAATTITPEVTVLFPAQGDSFGGIPTSRHRNEIHTQTMISAIHTQLLALNR